MRVAVVFFGVTRSPATTIESIRHNIYDCNANSGHSLYTIASLNLPATINSPRSGEVEVEISPGDMFLLGADFYAAVRQDDAAIQGPLDAAQERYDAFNNNWSSVRNTLHQLASLQRAWRICGSVLEGGFDYFLFVRPDLIYLDEIRIGELIATLPGEGNIAVPPWHSYGGFNDRFAFADAVAARHYAERLSLVPEFCTRSSLHPERLLAYALEQGGCKVWGLPVRAQRVRANGVIVQEAFDAAVLDLPLPPRPEQVLVAPTQTQPPLPPGPAAAAITLYRVTVDGFPRVSPLRGAHYLRFLEVLHRQRQVSRYLEIGTQNGMSLKCATGQAVAIDPNFILDKMHWQAQPGINLFEMTSDQFFARHDPRRILGGTVELAFIDGMHLSEYVLRDFVNVERNCTRDSLIVLHDAIPQNFEMTERDRRPAVRRDKAMAAAWTGDVWRVVSLLRRERPDLDIRVLNCQPTGLVLIGNLDPNSYLLPSRLDDLTRALAEQEPAEADFWSFIGSLPVIDTQSLM